MESSNSRTSHLINLFSKSSGKQVVRGSEILQNSSKDGSTTMDESPKSSSLPVIQITDEYCSALTNIKSGNRVVFITGKAGTGKSTFIKFLRENLDPDVPVLAPTGVAAINANGQTIHSFFQLPPRIINHEDIKLLKHRKLFEKLRLLIIDEISMVRADLMDAIDFSLRKNTSRENEPFGGVQLILIGDLLQLPPVVATDSEMRYLYDRYKTPYFLSADCLQSTPPLVIELTKVYRQQDENFISLLSQIRIGESLESSVDYLNSCCFSKNYDSDTLILTSDNASADKINNMRLNELSGERHEYEGTISGRFNMEENRLPAPKCLKLKAGAHVMFTKNDPDHRWVNGTSGKLLNLTDQLITVETNNGVFDIKRETWETIQYIYDEISKKIKAEIIGTYTQFPLMLAWAITIHKSQGKTLDKVLIDLGSGAFAEGQVYVALSRCKSLTGIRLKRPIRISDIKVDQVVKEFYSRLVH